MFSENPFAGLSVSVPPWLMQLYAALMIACVVGGTLFDMLHKGNAAYFFANRRKVRSLAQRQVSGGEKVLLAAETVQAVARPKVAVEFEAADLLLQLFDPLVGFAQMVIRRSRSQGSLERPADLIGAVRRFVTRLPRQFRHRDCALLRRRFLLLNLLLIPLIGIPAIMKARDQARSRIEQVRSGGQEIVSTDGESRLVVPKDWREMKELNEAAELQAGNPSTEQYIMVLSEKKSDFDNMTLSRHHQLTRESMMQKMQNPSAGQTRQLTINGKSALQDEISGTQSGMDIVFLHTTIEADE